MHVGIVMGSDSDLPVMKKAFSILDDFGVTYDVTIASAHRAPKKLADFVAAEEEKGVGAFIAGAGMAAALPGVVASLTLIDGTKNAAFLAVEIGAVSDPDLFQKYKAYREKAAKEIFEKDAKLQKELGR